MTQPSERVPATFSPVKDEIVTATVQHRTMKEFKSLEMFIIQVVGFVFPSKNIFSFRVCVLSPRPTKETSQKFQLCK